MKTKKNVKAGSPPGANHNQSGPAVKTRVTAGFISTSQLTGQKAVRTSVHRLSAATRLWATVCIITALGCSALYADQPIQYHGGPILTDFTIYPLFYGNWTAAARDARYAYLQKLAAHISGLDAPAGYKPEIWQYGINSATIGSPANSTAPYISPAHNISEDDVRAIIRGNQTTSPPKLPPYGRSTLIMLFLSQEYHLLDGSGQTPANFAYHGNESATSFYAVIQQNEHSDYLTSHEIFEAAADPAVSRIPGWDELSDSCLGITMPFGEIAQIHDNTQGGICSAQPYLLNRVFPVMLVAKHSGKCLDIVNGSVQNGAMLQQWTCGVGSPQQKFWLFPLGNNTYTIEGVSGKALDVVGASSTNGAGIQQWDYSGGTNQQWSVTSLGDGYFKIVNRLSGKVLDVTGGVQSTNNGALLQQWDYWGADNQKWQILRDSEAFPAGVYNIVAKHSGKCLDVPYGSLANGVQLQQWDCDGLPQQKFWVTPAGTPGTYKVFAFDGRALDVKDNSTNNGSPIQQWSFGGNSNQLWSISSAGPNEYAIFSSLSGKALDVTGGTAATQNGALLQQWDYWGNANQKWILVPVQYY